MDSTPTIYDLVVDRLNDQQWLREHRLTQKLVALDVGIPFSTVCKIAQQAVKDPSVHRVQKLYDYFMRLDPRMPGSPNGAPGREESSAAGNDLPITPKSEAV